MPDKFKFDDKQERLLESVAHITSLRERESLEISSVTTLNEMIHPRKIVLYKIYCRKKQEVMPDVILDNGKLVASFGEYNQEAVIHLDSRAEFVNCRDTGKMVVVPFACKPVDCYDYVYPLFGNHNGISGFF